MDPKLHRLIADRDAQRLCSYLKSPSVNPNVRDDNDLTPLMHAAIIDFIPGVDHLLNHPRIDPLLSRDGKRASDLAYKNGNGYVGSILKAAETKILKAGKAALNDEKAVLRRSQNVTGSIAKVFSFIGIERPTVFLSAFTLAVGTVPGHQRVFTMAATTLAAMLSAGAINVMVNKKRFANPAIETPEDGGHVLPPQSIRFCFDEGNDIASPHEEFRLSEPV